MCATKSILQYQKWQLNVISNETRCLMNLEILTVLIVLNGS